MEDTIKDTLLTLEFGKIQSFKNRAVIPRTIPVKGGPQYLTLKEALEQQLLKVTEVSEGGSVPNLKVTNKGDTSVLLLDGEELAGAKQNRVLNTTILLGKKSKTVIPVSCTEMGRWSYSMSEFADSEVVMSPGIRSMKAATVSASLERKESYCSDQGAVWSAIEEISRKADVDSPSSAMRDVYTSRRDDLDSYLKAFEYQPDQRGLFVFIDGKVTGFDLLSRAESYEVLHAKMVKSYAMDAMLRRDKKAGKPSETEARQFIARAVDCQEEKYRSKGLGWDYRYEGKQIVGSALIYRKVAIHTAFFQTDGVEESGDEVPISSSRKRRDSRMGRPVI